MTARQTHRKFIKAGMDGRPFWPEDYLLNLQPIATGGVRKQLRPRLLTRALSSRQGSA